MAVAYCTNIHPGADLEALTAELERTWPRVRARLAPDRPFALGMWFSAQTAHQIATQQSIGGLREWLDANDLTVQTLNGFPYGDFHQQRVKQLVYQPNWFDRSRWNYTMDLVTILRQLVPPRSTASISTLPLAWRHPAPTPDQLQAAAQQLRDMAGHLHGLAENTGIMVRLCLEPEPGCYLQCSDDVVCFMNEFLFGGSDEEIVREHIGVCHDICHAAVVFESQQDALHRYQAAGISLGKVQISSAIQVDFYI
jgi:hypothetical protein